MITNDLCTSAAQDRQSCAGGLDAGAWAGAELRSHTHSTKRTGTSHLLLLHRASAVLWDRNTSERGRYSETLPFYFGRAQTETFGNDDAKTHVCVSVCERKIERECVSEGEQHQVQEDSVHTHTHTQTKLVKTKWINNQKALNMSCEPSAI